MKQKKISSCYYNNGFFRGFAYDPFVPSFEVSLYENDALLAKSFSNLDSTPQDLQQIDVPPIDTCMFALKIPSFLFDGKKHTLTVKVDSWKLESDPQPVSINFCYGDLSGDVIYEDGIYQIDIDFKTTPKKPPLLLIYEDIASAPIATEKIFLDKTIKSSIKYQSTKELYFKCNNVLLENSKRQENSQIVGKVISITKNEISGFIIDVANLHQTLSVQLFIDGIPVTLITPMQKNRSIAKLLKIDFDLLNNCFFKLETPEILLDGEKHKVEVICKENSKVLDGGLKEIQFTNGSIPYEKIVKHIIKSPLGKPQNIANSYDVSIVILNRNGKEILKELFESFLHFNSVNAEFIIVDHASDDDSLEMIKEFSSKIPIRVKALNYNDSFSASCNLGASMAKSDNLLFLNNDIILVQDILPPMLKNLEDESIGFIGIKLIKKDTGHISEVQHLGVRFKLVQSEYFPYEVGPTSKESQNEYAPTLLPAVTGAVMLCRKTDFDKIGGFDVNYFYGFEDVEICIRMNKILGKKSLCRNDLAAFHKHGFTRLSGREKSVLNTQEHNTKVLFSSMGLWLKQKARDTLFSGDKEWSLDTLNIAFVVNDRLILDERTDSALIISVAKTLKAYKSNIKLFFLSPDYDWYDVYGIDILVLCDKNYDLRLLNNEKASITRVLYVEEELEIEGFKQLPWFNKYDLLASNITTPDSNIVAFNENNIEELLSIVSSQLRVAILVPVFKKDFKDSDYLAMAELLCNELREENVKVSILYIEEWGNPPMVVDVYVHLYDSFCQKYHFSPRRAAINILWILDDVNNVNSNLLQEYDDVWTLQEVAKKPYFSPKIQTLKKANVDIKRYVMLGSFDEVPPVLYPNTYYVCEGITYPTDDGEYAKTVEIYISTELKSFYKPFLCKTVDNIVYTARFKDMSKIFSNNINLKKWKGRIRYNFKNLIESLIIKIRK